MSTTVKENVDAAIVEAVASEVAGKKFWLSKTFWTNVLAAVAVLVQVRYGFILSPEYQVLGLSLVNLALRKITSQAVVW